MKTKDLLSQISQLEQSLNDFSFEELNVSQASQLKKSFDLFKNQLENRIFQPSNSVKTSEESKVSEEEPNVNSIPDFNLLVAHASHEIRTPLNGIIGFTDLLKEDNLTEIQLERVNAIKTASSSLMEIINELLELSKLSAGLENFESVAFNLHGLVNDVMYLCKTLLNNREIALEAHIDDSIPEILIGDPSKLTQVLLNVLGNAIKFVHEGSIRLGIYLKQKKKDTYQIEFVIEDTGIGISEKDLASIFDPYKQVQKETYTQENGSGLGLSIVKQIIEKQGGDIRATSKIGVGSTFQFLLPFAKGTNKKLIKVKNKQKDESAKFDIKDLRVLVFEDNDLNQRLIEQRLMSWGCIAHVTDNAEYGLIILENHKIDVVLMDLKMPNKNGFEITELIRTSKVKHIREIPVIAVSADYSSADRKKCSQSGINDFILKPYVADELLNKLVRHTKPMKNKTVSSKSKPQIREVFADATKVNLAVLLEECMGKMDIIEHLIKLYKQGILEFTGVLSMHLPDGDLNIVAGAAHKIKAGLAMLQSESLHSIVLQIEDNLKSDVDLELLNELFKSFVEEYPLVEKAIDEQINALKTSQ